MTRNPNCRKHAGVRGALCCCPGSTDWTDEDDRMLAERDAEEEEDE